MENYLQFKLTEKKVRLLEKCLTDKEDISVYKLLPLRGSLTSGCAGNLHKYVSFLHNQIDR